MRVLIIGAGGHAQWIADLLLQINQADRSMMPVGYVDDDSSLHGREVLGIPVFGPVNSLGSIPHDALVVGIGNNSLRRRIFDLYRSNGEAFATACHPRAVIASEVKIGMGTVIGPSIVGVAAEIGDNVILSSGCIIGHHSVVASHTHVGPGAALAGEVFVSEGSMIGMGANILPQIRVGSWSVVGAGALVRADVPNRVVVIGMPARISKELPE